LFSNKEIGLYSDECVSTPVSMGHITPDGYRISNIVCGNGFSIIVESPIIKTNQYQNIEVHGGIVTHAKEITVLHDEQTI
jgi:hypothetical protein